MNIYQVTDLVQLKELLPLAYSYYSEGVLPYGFNENHWLNEWSEMLSFGAGKMWAAKHRSGAPCGAMGGLMSYHSASGDLTFGEHFFYCPEGSNGAGLWLYKRAENDLQDLGVKRIYLNSRLNFKPERVGKFYSYMGFRPNEIQWVKEIN